MEQQTMTGSGLYIRKHPFLPAPAAVALCFGLLCLSALSSCTGCSYNHQKAMGSIDNILGKVDTLMKKTDRFLEEHLPEEPPIDYEKEGVNMKHLFVFTDTTMTYNGKPFMPGMTIGELCEIFGHYERLAEPGIFIWDSMGITMVSDDESGKNSAPVSRMLIDWNIDLYGAISEDNIKWLKNRCPRQYFTGKIVVGGAVLGRGMHIDDFLKKTNLKFDNNPFPLLYYCDLYDWDYTKAPIHRREEYYTYMIRKSRDGTDIETFDIAINSRGSGAPPYEGPEYEKFINHPD